MWLFKKRSKSTLREDLIKEIKEERLDMKELFSNINNRDKVEQLYKELCKLTHPDNNPKRQEVAQELFTKVQRNRNDYNALLKLKNEIVDLLKTGER